VAVSRTRLGYDPNSAYAVVSLGSEVATKPVPGPGQIRGGDDTSGLQASRLWEDSFGGETVERVGPRGVEIRLSGDFTRLERVATSAGGNLQRTVRYCRVPHQRL
jgi:hypothetical protein